MLIKIIKKNLIIIFCGIGIVIVLFVILKASGNSKSVSPALENFAKCLTQKEAVMYGAKWCGYCQKQRNFFGSSFKFINYVECADNPKQCIEAKIEGYPTWILAGGLKLIGLQSLENLAQASGCSLNAN